MKKILMITHSSHGGGAETVFLKAIESLYKKNKLVIILNSKNSLLSKKLENKNLNIKILKNFWLNNSLIKFTIGLLFFNLISILRLIKIIKKENIDIIYSSSIVNYIGSIVGIVLKIPHVWHIHEMNNLGHQWFNPKLDFLVRYLFKKSEIIFISEGVKESWLKRLGLKETEVKYKIIYNPIKKLKKSPLKTNKIISIGCAGTFCKNKNQELLIETFIKLKNRYSNIHLKLAGEGNENGAKSIIKNRISEKEYTIYGYKEIQDFLDEIDILVVPSISESWSLIALEAAFCGAIPLITTQTSIKEVLIENKNAYYVNPFEKEELYLKLEHIILFKSQIERIIKKNNKKLFQNRDFNLDFKKKMNCIFQNY